VAWTEAHPHAKCHLDPFIQPFGHNRHGLCPLFGGGPESPSNTMSLGPRPTSLRCGILISAICDNRYGPKIGGGFTPLGEGSWSPSSTLWAWAEAYTCMPSFILIHAIVLPQYINVTDRIGRTDRQQSVLPFYNRFVNGGPKTIHVD